MIPELDRCHLGDALAVLKTWPDAFVQTCVTSPPYWGMRSYGVKGELGSEPRLEDYIANVVAIMREIRRVLRKDGTLWLNLGECWTSGNRSYRDPGSSNTINHREAVAGLTEKGTRPRNPAGMKSKDVVGLPWTVAFALRADGWFLREGIVWEKPNASPESVRDRCTNVHEFLFHLARRRHYYHDQDAISEPVTGNAHPRGKGVHPKAGKSPAGARHNQSFAAAIREPVKRRNRRSVWRVATEKFPGEHFATMPRRLVLPCILAGSRPSDIVLDPFLGSGTVAEVAQARGRRWLGIELNPKYLPMQLRRATVTGLL